LLIVYTFAELMQSSALMLSQLSCSCPFLYGERTNPRDVAALQEAIKKDMETEIPQMQLRKKNGEFTLTRCMIGLDAMFVCQSHR